MSSVINPVGPEDPQVYWRRRALVIGIAIVVLLILFLIFRPKGGEPVPVASSASPTPTPTFSTPSPTTSSSASASSSLSPGACPDSDVGVTVTTSAQSYPADSTPQITLSITNTGGSPCERDVGSAANTVEITSGGVKVWSSDDCSEPGTDDIVSLEPGQPASVTVDWPGTVSAPGCPTPPAEQAKADPGVYDAIGKNGSITSKKASFTLE